MNSPESQIFVAQLATYFDMAIKYEDEYYWKHVDYEIDRLKDGFYRTAFGVVSIDDVIDSLCHMDEGELVAYIMQRRKGIGSGTEEEL